MRIFDLGGKQAANATNSNVDILGVAAATSAIKGGMSEVVDKVINGTYNDNLANKVINEYGHKSIFEHAVFTFCLEDVSLLFEQFLIEHRLISITIKSRRYVNFLTAGVVPQMEIPGLVDVNNRIEEHVNELFDAYNEAVSFGMHIEYARYILPIGTCSNMILTINAKEIVNVLENILAHHSDSEEFMQIARAILHIVNKTYPKEFEIIHNKVFNVGKGAIDNNKCAATILNKINFYIGKDCVMYGRNHVDIPSYNKLHKVIHIPTEPDKALEYATMFYLQNVLGFNTDAVEKIMKRCDVLDIPMDLVKHNHKVLEMVGSTTMDKIAISISSLTHLTRHRIQTLFVPNFKSLLPTYHITPHYLEIGRENVKYDDSSDGKIEGSKLKIWSMIKKNKAFVSELNAVLPEEYAIVYLMTGGTMLNVYSIMNFRERAHFMQLRKCSRAQMEIRQIAHAISENNYGELGKKYLGTKCYIGVGCPEKDKGCK